MFIDQNVSLVSTKDSEIHTLKFAVLSNEDVSEMEVKLDQINVPNKIQLHKHIGDVLYLDILH